MPGLTFEPTRMRRVGAGTLALVIVLPVLLVGLVVWSLWTPASRLPGTQAAIVNEDEPVTVNGQTTPIGRSFAANLIDNTTNNYDWVLTDASDAEQGLASGEYVAVMTIPEHFSSHVVSVADADPSNAKRAHVTFATTANGGLLDPAVSTAIADASTAAFSQVLGENYLGNVYSSFNTINESFGEAANGAGQLAAGAGQANSGAQQVDVGSQELADGLVSLQGGAGSVAAGAQELTAGTQALQTTTAELAAGADELARDLAELDADSARLAAVIDGLAVGSTELARGAAAVSTSVDRSAQAAASLVADAQAFTEQQTQLADDLVALDTDCLTSGASADFCDRLTFARDDAEQMVTDGKAVRRAAVQLARRAKALALESAALARAIDLLAEDLDDLAGPAGRLAEAITEATAATAAIAAAADQLAAGAAEVNVGAEQVAVGTQGVAEGAATAAGSGQQLAAGAGEVAGGTTQLVAGADELASQLGEGAEEVPTYTDSQSQHLAGVVSSPITIIDTDGKVASTVPTTQSVVPLALAAGLWVGAMVGFVVLTAVSSSSLTSNESSLGLMARGMAPVLVLVVSQALLVSGLIAVVTDLSVADAALLLLVGVVVACSFTAVNQGLTGVFGGLGRLLAAVMLTMTLATSLMSTAPDLLQSWSSLLPTTMALNAFTVVITGEGGLGGPLAGLVVWGGLGTAAAIVATGLARRTTVRSVLAETGV